MTVLRRSPAFQQQQELDGHRRLQQPQSVMTRTGGGVDAAARVGARPVVGVLQIHHRVWNVAVALVPLHPAGEVDDGAEEGLHEDHVGVFLPRAAEEGLHPREVRALVCGDRTVLERKPGSVQGVVAPLRGDHVVSAGLAGAGAANQEPATQEGCPGVAEHEVHGAADVRLQIHLVSGVGVEGILIPLDRAPVDQGEVRS